MTDSGQWVWGSHLNSLVKTGPGKQASVTLMLGKAAVEISWELTGKPVKPNEWAPTSGRDSASKKKKNKLENAQERYIMMVFGFCIMCTHAWIYTKTCIQCAHSYKLLYKSTPSWQFFSCCISFSQTLSRTSLRVQTPPLVAHDICMDLTLRNDVSRGESVLPWYPEAAVEGTCDEQLDWDIILNWALTLD